MGQDHCFDHLADGECLSAFPLCIAGHEPVEAEVGVVCALLLGKQQGKTFLIGQLRPAGTMVVTGRGLRAAMQHDDERRRFRQIIRNMDPRPQGARIGAEVALIR